MRVISNILSLHVKHQPFKDEVFTQCLGAREHIYAD